MVSSTLCPAVHILGSQNVYSRAEGIADHYWFYLLSSLPPFYPFFFFFFFSFLSFLQASSPSIPASSPTFLVAPLPRYRTLLNPAHAHLFQFVQGGRISVSSLLPFMDEPG